MKYLPNSANVVRTADLTATNIAPSTVYYRTDTAPKVGGGRVSLSGSYTGASNTVIDVEVLDDGGSTRRVSEPVFSGVGNGTMDDVAAALSVDPQEIVVTLEDLGAETRPATAPFQQATLRALETGAAGNAIVVTVDASGLENTPTDYALAGDISEGNNEYIGDQWNFGAVALNPDGTIPPDAPRIRFGFDPQVYRPYRFRRTNRWVYGFSPEPVRDVPAGTVVQAVSGTWSVSISNGVDTEPFAGLTTLYSALAAIRDGSDLVEVVGPIVNDRLPGGQGAVDVSVWTQSYLASLIADGTDYAREVDIGLEVGESAPTEQLSIRCTDASTPGAERWTVRGQVSGTLAQAVTGTAYTGGSYSFEIPPAVSPEPPPQSAASAELDLLDRSANVTPPSLCTENLVVGAQAKAQTYEFVWRRRPPECDCSGAEVIGGPNSEYLGVAFTGETEVSEQSRLIRVQRLTAWHRRFVASNTGRPMDGGTADTREVLIAENDITLATRCANIFAQGLATLVGGTTNWPEWEASTVVPVDTIREPTTPNGYRYAYSGGTTGATEPTWPIAEDATVADGTGTWTNIGISVWGMYDQAFADLQADMRWHVGRNITVSAEFPLGDELAPAWEASTAYARHSYILPTTRNGHYYRLETVADEVTPVSGGTEPTWPTDGSTVTDGDFTWRDRGAYWSATTPVAKGATITPMNGARYRAVEAGTSGGTEPDWIIDANVPIDDGSVVWQMLVDAEHGSDLIDRETVDLEVVPYVIPELYYDRYTSVINDILAAAGLPPNFQSAGLQGNDVWSDRGGSSWFVSRDGLLPLQPGYYYHSARNETDEFGNTTPVSTKEFGIGVDIACGSLIEGDRLLITIDLQGVVRATYQPGDEFVAQINRATPLQLSGGQDGDDTLTWSVIGSEAGRLADYSLVLTALAGYDNGGISFAIEPGGIPFALGDQFTFSVEGARAQWRQDGGTWSAPFEIDATETLADGLSAVFTGGVAPSWIPGDRWTFAAEAVHGVDNLRQPTEPRCKWTAATVIDVTPDGTGALGSLLLADHDLPAGTTLTLQASDDDFDTVAESVSIPWQAGNIYAALDLDHARYRLAISADGSARWLFAGESPELLISQGAGHVDIGRLTKRYRLPGINVRAGTGVTVLHDALTQSSVDALLAALSHACTYDQRLLGIVGSDTERDAGIVAVNADSIDVADANFYQRRNGSRWLSLSLTLDAAA